MTQYLIHIRAFNMLAITYKSHILFSRKHIQDVRDDRLAFHLDQRFGNGIPGALKPLAGARHWDYDLHAL